MNTLVKSAVVVSLVAMGVGLAEEASAAKLVRKSIDFTDLYGPRTSEIYMDLGHGLTLSVTGAYHKDGPRADAPFDEIYEADVTKRYGYGLGVKSSPGDRGPLDGRGARTDFLRFDFSKDVSLHKVFFTGADYYDEFDASIDETDLHINNTLGTDYIIDLPEIGYYSGIHVANFKRGVDIVGDGTSRKVTAQGQLFDFYTTDRSDDYRVAGLKVWVEVPEPAMTWGLLGLGAMLVWSQRKRKNQTVA